ncbi:MAG TPA: AAA family ATPase [Candidatus Binatia bacterium]|nr:AAA family ATPase [Candidatus Binatia bacterium]
MRITRLEIRDFRRYHDLDVDLAPGLTVIRGPNEAGKTTIQRAIELALTRKVTSTGADLDALRPWDATNDDARPAVHLEFTYEDDEGVRQGSLEKVFRGSKGTVRLEIDGQTITDPTRAEQVLAELTGIPSEAFFRSTASVRHHEVADLDRDEAALRDRLQASISGADRGTSRAKRLLDRAIRDLQAKGERNPGQIKAARDEVARLERVVADGEAALAALERDRDALTVARERRATAEAVLRERRGMLEKARQAERLTAERASAEERFQRYRTAVEVATQLDTLRTSHPSPQPLPILRAGVERLRGLDARIRELRAALGSEVDVRFEVPPEPTWRPLSRVAVLVVLLGVVVAVGGVGLDVLGLLRLGDIPVYGGAALVGVGFVLALVGFWLRRRDRLARHLRDEEIARRLRGRSEMEEELKRAERDLAAQLAGLGLADLAAAEDLLAREEAHVAQIERFEAELRGLVGDEPVETLAGKRDEAALEIEQKRHALEALGPIAREPRARERLEVEVRDAEEALERARDDEARAAARVEANAVDADQVAAAAEQLALARERLAAVERRARVYAACLAAIETAERATMQTATRYLEKRMVADLARVTDGRYRRVAVDDRSLDIALFAPEKGGWVDVHQLSQGTIDLVYLAARLGLVRLVTSDRRPPLLLDDPFVTFDETRAKRALEVLRDLASDFQVIYLTCSDRYDSLADAVVELPAPTTVDDGRVEAPPPWVVAEAAGTPPSAAARGAPAASAGAPAARSAPAASGGPGTSGSR